MAYCAISQDLTWNPLMRILLGRASGFSFMGKMYLRNKQANELIDQDIIEHDIRWCEARLPGCLVTSFLQRAHRHKRDWYKTRGKEKLLYAHEQYIVACQSCHNLMEHDKKLTERVFSYLRGEEKTV